MSFCSARSSRDSPRRIAATGSPARARRRRFAASLCRSAAAGSGVEPARVGQQMVNTEHIATNRAGASIVGLMVMGPRKLPRRLAPLCLPAAPQGPRKQCRFACFRVAGPDRSTSRQEKPMAAIQQIRALVATMRAAFLSPSRGAASPDARSGIRLDGIPVQRRPLQTMELHHERSCSDVAVFGLQGP